ncbi:MAG: hypothetical protein JKY20_07985 [Alphaproteobacteria bacterium]|nr:hypothetical protein [Alphaproteobacteria bacterium]
MALRHEILDRYEDDLFGIPVVLRHAVIKSIDDDTGREFTTIPDEEGLAAAIAMARALCPIKLRPEDIRMMRKTLGMKSKDFAAVLDMDPTRLSRLEKDTDGLGGFSEKNIRQYVCARLKRDAPAISYDPAAIVTMEFLRGGAEFPKITFERVRLKMAESQLKSDSWDIAA